MKKYISWSFVLVLLVFCIYQWENGKAKDKKYNSIITSQNETILILKNKDGSQTASIKTLQVDKKQLQDIVINKDAKLKELAKEFSTLHSVVKYNTLLKIDSIKVVYRDTVPCIFERSGAIKEKWYSFAWQSNQKGVRIDSLKIPNETTVITGTQRKWFLGKETLVTNVTNSNPNVSVTGLKAAELTIETPWYKKWYVWLAGGLVGGVFLAK